MLHIKLQDRRQAEPDDPMGRAWYGYDPRRSPQELFAHNRGRWRLGPRAEEQGHAVFSYVGDHTIKFVAEITGIESIGDQRAIVGRVLPLDHPLSQRYVGSPSPDGHRNPITYWDDVV